MATVNQPVRASDIERAARAVEGADAADKLGALCLDVASRHAEGKRIFAGEKFAAGRAEEHDVDRDSAKTPAGDVLAILERGPETALERALIVAFFIRGLSDKVEADEEGEADSRVWKFVRHADWFELSTDYAVYALVDPVASDAAAAIWKEVAQAVVDDAAGRDGQRPEVRAKNAARLTALAASASESAAAALRTVVSTTALDEPTRLLASTLAGDGAEESATVPARLEGQAGRAPRGPMVELIRWASGWALLSWLVRGFGFLLGLRQNVELRLADRAIEVRMSTSLLGRVVREQEESWPIGAIDRAARQVRYPTAHLMVGAIALSFGVLVGGTMLFDGVRSGELILISVAAVLVALGAGLDLGLDLLVPGSRGRVAIDLVQRSRPALRLTRVPLEQADAFLSALRSAGARAEP